MSSKRKGLQRESSIFQSLSLQRQRLWTAPCLLQLDYLISLNVSGILPVGPSKPTGHFSCLPSTPLPVYTVVCPSLRGHGIPGCGNVSANARMVPGKLRR